MRFRATPGEDILTLEWEMGRTMTIWRDMWARKEGSPFRDEIMAGFGDGGRLSEGEQGIMSHAVV